MKAEATVQDELVDDITLLVEWLKKDAPKEGPGRELLSGLLRDLWILEQSGKTAGAEDDAAWLDPYLDLALAKLALAERLFPKQQKRAQDTAEHVRGLRDRAELLASLRSSVPAMLPGLAPEARDHLERQGVVAALTSPRLLKAGSGASPEALLAARLLEGLGVHLARQAASGSTAAAGDADVSALATRLEGWLEERGATLTRPVEGAAAPADAVKVQAAQRAAGKAAGQVVVAPTPSVKLGDVAAARAVVVTSPGAESHLLAAVRTLVQATSEDKQDELGPVLAGLGRTLRGRLDDAKATTKERAEAALDLLGAVRAVLDTPEALTPLLVALGKDFAGAKGELLLATPRTPFAASAELEGQDYFSEEIPPGEIVSLLRPGLRLAGEVVRPALVRVSQGSPPPGIIDEVLGLLPEGDARADHLRARLGRARCLAAGDAGALLARELADLALLIKDDVLGEAGRRALRLVLDEPPAQLSGRAGWDAVREFLDENLEQLLQEEQGTLGALRLVRPYLQALRTGNFSGARLRSLGESMDSLLRLYDETMQGTARAWLFSELERLGAEGYPPGGLSRRLVRTAAKALKGFYANGETTVAVELTAAMKGAGMKVYPDDGEKLESCPDPTTLFHRLDASWEDAPRRKVVGAFSPAVAVATTPEEGATGEAAETEARETGAVTVSLGAKPKTVAWLLGDELRGSRIGGAASKLADELKRLDRERLLAELKGDAGAERGFALGVARVVIDALKAGGWQRGDGDREALAPLFDLMRDELKVDILPGYLTFRRLRDLQRTLGDKVKVDVKREGARKISLEQIGATYRDELLQPLAMTWCTGPPPPYVEHLRKLHWFEAALEGKPAKIEMTPGAIEAVRDFDSPDAQSIDGVVRSLSIIVGWLAGDHPNELDAFTMRVKNAPELELDFFPLPGKVYPRERLLQAVDRAKSPDSISVVRDAGREEGQAIQVERIALYREGRCLSEEPKARFALKTLPKECEALQDALAPVLTSDHVPGQVKSELKGLITRMALVATSGQGDVELKAFKLLLQARLIDPTYPDSPENAMHKAGAYLAKRLEAAGKLKVDRFEGKKTIKDALAGTPEDAAITENMFCRSGSPELAEVRRPLVLLEGSVLQKAFLMKGVPTDDPQVLELDQVLTDTIDRLRGWIDGLGAVVDAQLDETQRPMLPRTVARIAETRKKMFEAHKKEETVLPVETQLRDLMKFIMDQVHRGEDSLALLPDRSYRGAYGELVFKDVIFRSTGPYTSKKFDITIDTTVVAGADTQALTGKFKKETSGPRPKRESMKVFSVVVPCFAQGGITIRPATVRVGEY